MNKKIGYCGIDCNACPCYKATIKNDSRMKMDLSIKWSKLFKETLLPREMNCLGCKQDKVLFKNCKLCKIRKNHTNESVS